MTQPDLFDRQPFAAKFTRTGGAVMRRAAREGIVRADGWAPARSSNLSPKVKWVSLLL